MTGQKCNTPNIFDFLTFQSCAWSLETCQHTLSYIFSFYFSSTHLQFNKNISGQNMWQNKQHFYCFKSSKVPISFSTITVPGIRKGFQRTFIIKIFMRQGPISGYNWQPWLQWPSSITFDVRQYLVILPQPQSLMSGQSFAKNVEFSAARCIFVLFFSRSDIREARGHQLDTAQTRDTTQ